MFKHDTSTLTARQMVDALRTLRDQARVQAHLFSLDAKQRWQELEDKLLGLQGRLEQGGDHAAAGAGSQFHELTRAMKDLVQELEGARELTEPVRTAMQGSLASCTPDDGLNRAAQIMWERDCGVVPVMNPDGSIAGIITDRDICMAAYTRGLSLAAMSVESAMSHAITTCEPSDSLGHALELMAKQQVRRLPVLEHGQIVGLLSLADIARRIRGHVANRLAGSVALARAVASISEGNRALESSMRAAE
jgi:CBS domain-containing protein